MLTVNKKFPCDRRNYTMGRTRKISFLVMHYVGALGSAKNNASYYGGSKVGASAHYFVGHKSEGGAIYGSVPEDCTAWHVGGNRGYKHPACRNANSIGIEMCCHQRKDGSWYFDRETVEAAALLAREIVARYGIPPENLLRHYDVTGKNCPAPFVNDGAAWAEFQKRVFEEENEMTAEDVKKLVASSVAEQLPAAVNEALADRDEVVAKAAQKVSPWAKEAWDAMTKKGVFDGTRPGGNMTREQCAVVLFRMGESV